MSKKPPPKDNIPLSFVLESTDNYIHCKNNILINNSQRQMYSYGDHEINYQRRFPPWDMLSFFVFLSQNHIIWKEMFH